SCFDIAVKLVGLSPAQPDLGTGMICAVGRGPTAFSRENLTMRKTFVAIAAAASLGLATMSAPTTAEARCWGFGCAVAVGLGVATGVAVGTAIANSAYPAYAPVAGYAPYPAYAGPVPVGCPGGYWARRPLVDPYGNVVGYSRPRFFCPPA